MVVNGVNIAVVAAWKPHCRVTPPSEAMTHLAFRREVVQGLTWGASRHRLKGPTAAISECVRFDGVEHYMSSSTQGRWSPIRPNNRPYTPTPSNYQRSQSNINNRLPQCNGPQTNGSNCAGSPPTGRSDFSTIGFHRLIGRI